jgi:hypothetical protein
MLHVISSCGVNINDFIALRDWYAFIDEQERLENILKWKEQKQRVRQWLSHFVPGITPTITTVMERQAPSSRSSRATNFIIQHAGSDSGRRSLMVSRAASSSLTLVNLDCNHIP